MLSIIHLAILHIQFPDALSLFAVQWGGGVDPPCRNFAAPCYCCSDGPHLYGTSPPMQKNGTWVGVLWWEQSVTSLMDKFVGIKLIKALQGQILEKVLKLL